MDKANRIISLDNVSLIRDGREILRDVTINVFKGDFIAITGPNGGGKTSLLRIMLKLMRPTSGTVSYFNASGAFAAALNVGYLPQKNMIDSRFPITVSELVDMGIPRSKQLTRAERKELVLETVELVGLSSHATRSIGALSGGQLQRALMGRAVISSPEVLVLDEPLSYVDRQFERKIYDIVSQMAERATILLVSHDVSRIASMANRHIIVNRTIESCPSGNHFIHYDCCDSHCD